MIAAGLLVVFVCIVGCVAVIKENRFILVSYIIMLVLIFILELATGVVAFIYRSEISDELLKGIRGKMNEYELSDDVTAAIDKLQMEYHCCGDIGAESWNSTSWKRERRGNNTVPDSCCKTYSKHCGLRDHPSNINKEGCLTMLETFFKEQYSILAGVGVGIGLCQLFGIITAIVLLRYIQVY
ncbi:CD151 antigen-like isoform X2 [Actinia tenebrosa]|nr:CD151 antigen-like isoform X2 [Actinia tenebrosa]